MSMQKYKQIILVGLALIFLVVPALAVLGNDSITPSAKRGSAVLPDSAKSGIGDIIDLAMYCVAIIAVLAAMYAAYLAYFSKDPKKRNEGLSWLGYIVMTSLLLGVVFAIINSILFT